MRRPGPRRSRTARPADRPAVTPVAFPPWQHGSTGSTPSSSGTRSSGSRSAVVYKFFDDQGNYLAAIVTYYAFIAIFPLLLIASSVLGLLLKGDAELRQAVLDLGAQPVPDRGHPDRCPPGPAGQRLRGRHRLPRRPVRRPRARPGRAERRQHRLVDPAQQPPQPGRQPGAQLHPDGPGRCHRAAGRDAVQRLQPPQRVRSGRGHRAEPAVQLPRGGPQRGGDQRHDAAGHGPAGDDARGAARGHHDRGALAGAPAARGAPTSPAWCRA